MFEATDGKIYCGSCCCEVVDLLAHVSSLDHDEAVVVRDSKYVSAIDKNMLLFKKRLRQSLGIQK